MSIRTMRMGDTIIPSAGMVPYEVEDVDRHAGKVRARRQDGKVRARRQDGKGRAKTFSADRLEEVDEGLWQECEERRDTWPW